MKALTVYFILFFSAFLIVPLVFMLVIGYYNSQPFKTVTKIESCAESGRCRVYFDDNSTDLLFYPYIGMKVNK